MATKKTSTKKKTTTKSKGTARRKPPAKGKAKAAKKAPTKVPEADLPAQVSARQLANALAKIPKDRCQALWDEYVKEEKPKGLTYSKMYSLLGNAIFDSAKDVPRDVLEKVGSSRKRRKGEAKPRTKDAIIEAISQKNGATIAQLKKIVGGAPFNHPKPGARVASVLSALNSGKRGRDEFKGRIKRSGEGDAERITVKAS